MQVDQLRKKDIAGLYEELKSLRSEHFKLRMQHGSGQLSQTHKLKDVKTKIAKVKTVINEHRLGKINE